VANISLKNGKIIGDFHKPYIIAEMNTSHFGNPDTAKTMIDAAKEAGCDCVKFQSWTSKSLYSSAHYKVNPIAKRMVDKFSLTDPALKSLAIYCRDTGIDFASTPYSLQEAIFLVEECGVPFIKIASMELNNHPYLDSLARLHVPLILSTGMGTMNEIRQAVEIILRAGNEHLVILHCVSVYPSAPELTQLQNIIGLRAEFPDFPIGYSDHTQGIIVPSASIALGACLIEKHFTLDKVRIGMDNQMATEPDQMAQMVDACQTVFIANGGKERRLHDSEIAQRDKMRRSLITTNALPAGHVITASDLDAKRPGTGIPPCDISQLIGRRLRRPIEMDEIISWDDLA
jgi:sialic acid synthase SpsE